ncbi:MAG: hypothetical protein Kow009_02880 [Spirochaetales bacterium]
MWISLVLGMSGSFVVAQPWGGIGRFVLDSPQVWVQENVEARRSFRQLFVSSLDELQRFRERVVVQRNGDGRVQVRTEETGEAVYILFLNERDGKFPLYSAGSWILKRDKKTGALLQVKIFFRTEKECFLRLFPKDGRTTMDVYLFGSLLYEAVPIGVSLSMLLTEPFQEILDRTRSTVNWSVLTGEVDPVSFDSIRFMVRKIREELPHLPDAEDGAMDRNGRLVFIESLKAQSGLPGFNCSGFAKWVADGLYEPRKGEYLDIDALKEKPLSRRGSRITRRFEDDRDPFFGLDWTRNIACTLAEASDPEAEDVRDVPFWKYREDVGYPVEEIEGILFTLSLQEPGYFYLGSINREFGTDPVLRQHVHVVVLFPYFDETGQLIVNVFERNVETGLSTLKQRFHGNFIHLVRIKADTVFDPPRIE